MKISSIIDMHSLTEWDGLIDDWVRSERDRYILKRRLIDGEKIERLAEDIGISPRQVNRIVDKWCTLLIKK